MAHHKYFYDHKSLWYPLLLYKPNLYEEILHSLTHEVQVHLFLLNKKNIYLSNKLIYSSLENLLKKGIRDKVSEIFSCLSLTNNKGSSLFQHLAI